jgi:hypothetical protein
LPRRLGLDALLSAFHIHKPRQDQYCNKDGYEDYEQDLLALLGRFVLGLAQLIAECISSINRIATDYAMPMRLDI